MFFIAIGVVSLLVLGMCSISFVIQERDAQLRNVQRNFSKPFIPYVADGKLGEKQHRFL